MRRWLLVLTMVVAAVLGTVPGTAVADVEPDAIVGSDGGEEDRLAAAALSDLETFWGERFGDIAEGRAFAPVAAYHSVDPSRTDVAVPCLRSPAQIEGNAFYCPAADVLGFDRVGLLPTLRRDFGDEAVVVVMAHEYGHAIQQRLGTQLPTIASEAQADCYGGLFLRDVREGRTANLRTDADGVDAAMAALVTFRDPVGVGAGDVNAHGNAFDRVSSFQAGFDGDAATCADISPRTREFTQAEFTSLRDRSTGGDLELRELVATMRPDLDRFFDELVSARGATWSAPRLGDAGCEGASAQGPVAVCLGDGAPSVDVDSVALDEVHRGLGDYATGTLLAARYAVAGLAALGEPTKGEQAGRRAVCLAGAYTGSVGDAGGFALSPGDLDEAVAVLLTSDSAATDTLGAPGAGTGYERVRVFRTGVDGGPEACGM